MERGEFYRIEKPSKRDPKGFRIMIIVSRQRFIKSKYNSVICAPVYSNRNGLSTEVEVGIDEGLIHDSSIRCDELISIAKFKLTNFIGSLSEPKLKELNQALKIALEIEN